MRPAAQITRTPRQWAEHRARERQRQLADALKVLRASRDADWYRWIVDVYAPARNEGRLP